MPGCSPSDSASPSAPRPSTPPAALPPPPRPCSFRRWCGWQLHPTGTAKRLTEWLTALPRKRRVRGAVVLRWSPVDRPSRTRDQSFSQGLLHNSQPTKFVFVTGGVVSSLGKGLTASSLGALLS